MNAPGKEQVVVEKEVICPPPKTCVRDRIMSAATELFYRRGIRAVGVDTITSEAGTNKMSFYRNFSSKDELVAEYHRSRRGRHVFANCKGRLVDERGAPFVIA